MKPLLILILASASFCPAQENNLLRNASFEELGQGRPECWSVPNRNAAPEIDRRVIHSGTVSLRFMGDGTSRALRQKLKINPSGPFIVSGWVRCEKLNVSVGDSAFLYVHVIYKDQPYKTATHAYHRIVPGTYDWRRIRVRVTPNPKFVIREILLTCTAKFRFGTLWFDDLEIDTSLVKPDWDRALEQVNWLRDALTRAGQKGADVSAPLEAAESVRAQLNQLGAALPGLSEARARPHLEAIQEKTGAILHGLPPSVASILWESLSPSPEREIRALYHGSGKNLEEVQASLDRVAYVGANALYPSLGSWRGVTYSSELVPTLPEWKSIHGVELLIAEARKRGITVIPYLAIFNEGEPGSEARNQFPPNFFAQRHPDDAHRKLAFPAPSHPEVRQWVVKVAVELMQRYGPDGLGLDYIRYPRPDALCVCERCRGEIRQRYKFDVLDGNPWKDQRKRKVLQAWRAEQITATVRAVTSAVRKIRPKALLMAHCLREPDGARQHYGQDWPTFAKWLDLVTTMTYGKAAGGHAGLFAKQAAALKGKCRYVPGIGGMPPQHAQFSPRDWLDLISLARQYGDGVAIYAIRYITPSTVELLRHGPFRKKAAFPMK